MFKRFIQEYVTSSARRSILIGLAKARDKKLDLMDPLQREQICDLVLDEIGNEIEKIGREGSQIIAAIPKGQPPRRRRPL